MWSREIGLGRALSVGGAGQLMCAGQRETETTNNDKSILCKYLCQSSRLSPLCDRLGQPHLPILLINNILFVLFVNILNQFQNQWMTGLGKENEQNTSLNISNLWQTNLGIGPLGLFQQFGTQQFGTNSVNGFCIHRQNKLHCCRHISRWLN